MLAISILLDILCPFLKIYWYFSFSIKKITKEFQLWRLFTNFLVKPSKHLGLGIVFDTIFLYSHVYKLESEAKRKRQYSTFFMTTFLLCFFNIVTTFIFFYAFGIKESRSLVKELVYSFIAISSYKNPDEKTLVFYIPMKNKYVPIATMFFNVSASNNADPENLTKPIIGYISGFLICLIMDKYKINITPKFIKKWFKEKVEENEEDSFNNGGGYRKKEIDKIFNAKIGNTSKVGYRKKESVIEGNEFQEMDRKHIKWD